MEKSIEKGLVLTPKTIKKVIVLPFLEFFLA
jgi:hypothetical protein